MSWVLCLTWRCRIKASNARFTDQDRSRLGLRILSTTLAARRLAGVPCAMRERESNSHRRGEVQVDGPDDRISQRP